MPKIVVVIEYDHPIDPYWLNPNSVQLCLESYCKNTKFDVSWADGGDPWIQEDLENLLRFYDENHEKEL